jgi:hypothetical protein
MNTYQIARRLVKAIQTESIFSPFLEDEPIRIMGRAESLEGWGKDGVRILSNYGGLDGPLTVWANDWLQTNAPGVFGEPSDGGECLTLYQHSWR